MVERGRGLGRDLGLLAGGYVGRTLAYLGLTLLLTRFLGPADFGRVSLFLALAYGIAYLAATWPFLAVPILAPRLGSVAPVFRPALVLAVAGTAVSAALVLPVGAALLGGYPETALLLTIFALALVGLQGLYSVLQSQRRMGAIAAVQTAERGLALCVVLALGVVTGLTLVGAQLALAGAAALACVLSLRLLPRTPLLRDADRPPASLREVLHAVGPMAVVTACAYGVAWGDVLILAGFVSDAEVGVYALAYQVYTVVLTLAGLWIVVALPAHSRAEAEGSPSAQLTAPGPMTGAARLWAAGSALTAVVSMLALAPVFGEEFERGLAPLALLLAGATVLAPYMAAVPALLASGRARLLAVVSVAGVGLNIALDVALIPAIGLWGPAVATLAQVGLTTAWVLVALGGRSLATRMALAVSPAFAVTAALSADPTSVVLLGLAVVVAVALAWRPARDLAGQRGLAGLVTP